MVFGLPAIGETSWGQKILDSINAVKATADAALPASASGTGTYVPTGTAVANVTDLVPSTALWARTGDTVSVSGRVTITPTAGASTATSAGLSLPVASDLASASSDLFGTAADEFGHVAAVKADVINNRAQINYPAASTANYTWYYSFTYKVL